MVPIYATQTAEQVLYVLQHSERTHCGGIVAEPISGRWNRCRPSRNWSESWSWTSLTTCPTFRRCDIFLSGLDQVDDTAIEAIAHSITAGRCCDADLYVGDDRHAQRRHPDPRQYRVEPQHVGATGRYWAGRRGSVLPSAVAHYSPPCGLPAVLPWSIDCVLPEFRRPAANAAGGAADAVHRRAPCVREGAQPGAAQDEGRQAQNLRLGAVGGQEISRAAAE